LTDSFHESIAAREPPNSKRRNEFEGLSREQPRLSCTHYTTYKILHKAQPKTKVKEYFSYLPIGIWPKYRKRPTSIPTANYLST